MNLRAEAVEVPDYHAAVDLFFERGWTDGLPVVPPTDNLIAGMLAGAGRDPAEELGEMAPRLGVVTVEKAAINAVMAGCKPEYFPVVLAAVEALLDPRFNIGGVNTTTHMCQPLTIVSGPVARAIGMNAAEGVFGSGNRANGSIGRALSLIRWNIGGSVPGEADRGTLSHPGRWSYCIAESEESPWPHLHADLGLPVEASAATVFAGEGPHSLIAYGEVHEVLHTFCHTMAITGSNHAQALGEMIVVLNPYVAKVFADAGWKKSDIQAYLWEHARQPVRRIRACGPIVRQQMDLAWPLWMKALGEDELAPLTERPEEMHIVVTGGNTYFCAWIPGWGHYGGFAVTRAVRGMTA